MDKNLDRGIVTEGMIVAVMDSATERCKIKDTFLCDVVIASRNGMALFDKQVGKSAHAYAADSYKMKMSIFFKHRVGFM